MSIQPSQRTEPAGQAGWHDLEFRQEVIQSPGHTMAGGHVPPSHLREPPSVKPLDHGRHQTPDRHAGVHRRLAGTDRLRPGQQHEPVRPHHLDVPADGERHRDGADAGRLHHAVPAPVPHRRRHGGPLQPQVDDDGQRPGRHHRHRRHLHPLCHGAAGVLASLCRGRAERRRQHLPVAGLFGGDQHHGAQGAVRPRQRPDVADGGGAGRAGAAAGRHPAAAHRPDRHPDDRRADLLLRHRRAVDRPRAPARAHRGG